LRGGLALCFAESVFFWQASWRRYFHSPAGNKNPKHISALQPAANLADLKKENQDIDGVSVGIGIHFRLHNAALDQRAHNALIE